MEEDKKGRKRIRKCVGKDTEMRIAEGRTGEER